MPRQPGAKAIIAYKGKMLLLLRDNKPTISCPNMWSALGGGIEEGESPEEAIRRELKEEMCVEPANIEPCDTSVYDDGSVVYRFFATLTPEEYEKVALGDEGQRLGWFTYEEAAAFELPGHFKIYFDKEKEKIKDLLKRSDSER